MSLATEQQRSRALQSLERKLKQLPPARRQPFLKELHVTRSMLRQWRNGGGMRVSTWVRLRQALGFTTSPYGTYEDLMALYGPIQKRPKRCRQIALEVATRFLQDLWDAGINRAGLVCQPSLSGPPRMAIFVELEGTQLQLQLALRPNTIDATLKRQVSGAVAEELLFGEVTNKMMRRHSNTIQRLYRKLHRRVTTRQHQVVSFRDMVSNAEREQA